MNLPEIEWETGQVKPDARHKQIHADFLTMLQENDLQQLVKQPTHTCQHTLETGEI